MLLTSEQITHFQENGYVALEKLFDKQEIQAMLVELERFKQAGLGRNVATDGDGQTHSQSQINYQVIPLNDKSTLFRALPFSPKVVECVQALIGEPIVRHLDQIFLKPGQTGAGTDWHQDNAYFQCPDPTKGTAMWVALHDAHIQNGTLHVIPQSHRESFAHDRDLTSDHHIHIQVDEDRAVPIELPAGGVVFFNYGTAHATKRNNTDHERAGLAYHFLNATYLNETRMTSNAVHLSGPQTTGGEAEYGVKVADTWEAEVVRLVTAS